MTRVLCEGCQRWERCERRFCLDTDPWPACGEHKTLCWDCRPEDCEECQP